MDAAAQEATLSLEIDTSNVAREVEADVTSGGALKVFAENFEVVNQGDADLFAGWRNGIDDRIKAIIDKLAPAKQAAHEAHKRICSLENEAVLPLRAAMQIANRKLADFQREEERKAAIEKARLEKEQREREEAARLAEALAHEQAGDHEQAAAVLEAPIVTAAVAAPKPVTQGIQYRETWSAQVSDKMKLVKAVACVCGKCECKGNLSLLGLVDANQPSLNAVARAQKANLNIPGVKAISDKQVARGR
jgi:hypothetical protein